MAWIWRRHTCLTHKRWLKQNIKSGKRILPLLDGMVSVLVCIHLFIFFVVDLLLLWCWWEQLLSPGSVYFEMHFKTWSRVLDPEKCGLVYSEKYEKGPWTAFISVDPALNLCLCEICPVLCLCVQFSFTRFTGGFKLSARCVPLWNYLQGVVCHFAFSFYPSLSWHGYWCSALLSCSFYSRFKATWFLAFPPLLHPYSLNFKEYRLYLLPYKIFSSVFNQKTLYSAYKKRTKNMEVDMEAYNKAKEEDPEFYRNASSLQYGKVLHQPAHCGYCALKFRS